MFCIFLHVYVPCIHINVCIIVYLYSYFLAFLLKEQKVKDQTNRKDTESSKESSHKGTKLRRNNWFQNWVGYLHSGDKFPMVCFLQTNWIFLLQIWFLVNLRAWNIQFSRVSINSRWLHNFLLCSCVLQVLWNQFLICIKVSFQFADEAPVSSNTFFMPLQNMFPRKQRLERLTTTS